MNATSVPNGPRLHAGKSKVLYQGPDADTGVMEFTDAATAGNGAKRAEIPGKGACNNAISDAAFRYLAANGIATHHLRKLDATRTLVRRVDIVPLEVIVRNVAAGSFSTRYGVAEGTPFASAAVELCYKDDSLGDPPINESCATALGLASRGEIESIATAAETVNRHLVDFFAKARLRLIDVKLEFGRRPSGLLLADEVSPDTCRLWDMEDGTRLDKDRFRRDLGGVEEMYREIALRVAAAWPQYGGESV